MKLSSKLVLPCLAMITSFAFTVEPNQKTVYLACRNPDKELILYTAATIAASSTCFELATLGDQNSAWRNSLSTIGAFIAGTYYLNIFFEEYSNPLLRIFGAMIVWPSAAYAISRVNPSPY